MRAHCSGSIFGRTSNLYVTDRCFVPRRICKFHVQQGLQATLLLPREGPSLIHVPKQRFDVVLGAAQVVGVLARNSFASILEQAEGGLPILNLGRGAAGPHIYTDAGNWPAIAPLLTNARAIIVCVMAGRSSPNAESAPFSGQSFGSEQLRAFDRVLSLSRSSATAEREHADQLRRSSLAAAQRDYAELFRRIRAGAPAHGSAPRILLVWFSPCPLSGCSQLWEYPQYFVRTPGERSVLAGMQQSLGVEVVDASYGHLPPSPPYPMDQCASCAATGAALCNSVQARQDARQANRMCGQRCGLVRDPYYPDDAAHEHAARVILEALNRPTDGSAASAAASPTAPAPPPLSAHEQADAARPLAPISLERKLFHSHIHKASGTTFIAYLAGLDGVSDCSEASAGYLIKSDHTKPSTWRPFQRWWFEPNPACTFVSVEEPELGNVYNWLMRARMHQTAPPQIISFMRHPFARCRSHWRYEQVRACGRHPIGAALERRRPPPAWSTPHDTLPRPLAGSLPPLTARLARGVLQRLLPTSVRHCECLGDPRGVCGVVLPGARHAQPHRGQRGRRRVRLHAAPRLLRRHHGALSRVHVPLPLPSWPLPARPVHVPRQPCAPHKQGAAAA